jgi:ribonuclease HI
MTGKKKFYAVAVGRVPGIYTEWFGKNGAQVQVTGVAGARYRGFATRREAEGFVKAGGRGKPAARARKTGTGPGVRPAPPSPETDVVLYTDGGARPTNPGPGGYGVVLMDKGKKSELSGGFRWTTNNRMEIMACIVGLGAMKTPSAVTLYSDSQYVVNAMTRGWAKGWRKRGWVKSDKKPALNSDLWKELLALCETHSVAFVWVKGHAGHPENERCDQLATEAASGADLPPDTAYETPAPP